MPAPDTSGPSPLGRPAFLHFLFARVSASLAFQIVSVAVGWQIYELSGSALDLGLIGLAQFLPMAALTLVVGHVADRYDRRKIVAICMAVEVLATLMLAVAALHGLGGKPLIYATLIIMSSARAFEAPTLSTLIPAVVPREWLPRATALSSSGGQIAQIAGPALGGVGYGLGAGWIYCVAAALYLTAFAAVASMKIDRTPPRKEPTTWHTLFAGITFIFQRRLLLARCRWTCSPCCWAAPSRCCPSTPRTSCRPAPGRWARCARAACGAMLMSLTLARLSLGNQVGRLLFSALMVFGLATTVFGLSTSIPLSIAALVVLGAADAVSVVLRSSLVQLNTPDHMLGRVSAVNTLFVSASNQLGEFESGVMAALVGAVPAVVIGGLGTVAVAGLWMWWFPELRKLRTLVPA